MCRASARRELAFVVALAASGLALVLIVAFVPWYSPGSVPVLPVPRVDSVVQVVDGSAAEASLPR